MRAGCPFRPCGRAARTTEMLSLRVFSTELIHWRFRMLKSVLTVLVLSLGFAFAGHSATESKADAKDCCKAKLACCSAGKACCAAPAKLGCCDKGMKCCAKDVGCCSAVQECCRKGEACCDEAKACCGAAPKKPDKEVKNCCDAGKCCCAAK